MSLISRYFDPPSDSFFIFGPRGTGKSTWLKQTYPNAYCIDLLDDETFRNFQSRPERLMDVVRANTGTTIFIIDEVQKVPSILNSVHKLVEEKKGYQFILTGSSARKLKATGVNLMAGRAILTHFHPFMASELGPLFSLETALQVGLIPLIASATDPAQKLQSYLALYLKEEIQMEGLVRQIGDFSRFLEVISFSHASLLNKSNIARESQTTLKMVSNYVGILEDLLLAFQLPIFGKRAKRKLIQSTKFYLFDSGVFSALRPTGYLDNASEIDGVALEGMVAQNLRAWCDYSSAQIQLFYWRTRGGTEVDFIVYSQDYFYAIEVKNARQVYATDCRPLKSFYADYPECTPIMLYRGKERLKLGVVLCLPVEEFLRELKPNSWPV